MSSVEAEAVEVEVQQIGVTEINDFDSHPVLSLQGDGLTPNQQEKMTGLLQRWTKALLSQDEDFA